MQHNIVTTPTMQAHFHSDACAAEATIMNACVSVVTSDTVVASNSVYGSDKYL
jgi:hypothetical protein